MSADFAVARVHDSFDSNLSREIAWIGAKETSQIAKITNRRRDVAAKIRLEPIR